MQIALRRGDISVTKDIFYDVDVDAARVQPRPQGVTQIMKAKVRPPMRLRAVSNVVLIDVMRSPALYFLCGLPVL